MRKSAYIDPITDYLLHDPEEISAAGAIGRGGLTLGGIGAGGYGASKSIDRINKLLNGNGKNSLTKANRLQAILGASALGGLLGHFTGGGLFGYSDSEKIQNKLDNVLAKVEGISMPETNNLSSNSLADKLKAALLPRTNYEKFKDAGSEALSNLKDTGIYGWETIKDQFK